MVRVLVVDDEPSIRETLGEFLTCEGHDVRIAGSVAAATAQLADGEYDIVVTDIIMPGVSGIELLGRIRETAPHSKVVLITGEPSYDSAADAVRFGAFDYLTKPVTQSAICRVVASAALVKGLEDENRRHQQQLERLVEIRTRQISEYTARLREVAERTKGLARCAEIETLAPRVLDLFAQSMGADGGAFFRRNDDHLAMIVSLDPRHQPRRIDLPPRSGSVMARVLELREGFVVRDIADEADLVRSGWTGYRDGSLLALPCLDVDGNVTGVVTLHNKHQPPFTEEDLEIARIIAGHSVEAIRAIELNRKVRESEERYRTIAEDSLAGIFIREGENLVYYNSRMATLLGYEVGDQSRIGMRFVDLIHPEDRARIIENMVRRGLGEPAQCELRLLRRDGTSFDAELLASQVEYNGRPAAMGTVIDLTDRKRTEERIRILAALLDASPASITVLDLDGNFLYVNQKTLDLHGYTHDEMLNLNLRDLDDPESAALIDPRMRLIRERGEASFEASHRRKDGSLLPLFVNVKQARWGEQEVFLSIASDITEQKRAAEEQARLSAQLLQSQKMEAVGRLAGGIAHDFNNLLTAILGYAEIVSDRLGHEHALWSEVNEIVAAAERAAALTRQILAFSRRQIVEPRIVDLNDVVFNAKRMLERLIGEDIDLIVRIDPELRRVRVDPGQIDQILVNLAMNARDAMPRGGRLVIETRDPGSSSQGCAPPPPDQECVMLSVRDTGFGMDAETQARAFEPFFTTKERGTGLGLSTVRDIVARHGGHISLSSSVGGGTTFDVVFPVPVVSNGRIEDQGDGARIVGGNETVLIAEDDGGVRRLATAALTKLGYYVLESGDIAEARRLSREKSGAIHLLLTDVVMPVANGRELFESLAATRPEMKVLFMSGYTHDVISLHGVLAEGVQLLQKPFTLEALAAKVRSVLDG